MDNQNNQIMDDSETKEKKIAASVQGIQGNNETQSEQTGPNAIYWIVGGLMLVAGIYSLAKGNVAGGFMIAIVIIRAFVFMALGK